jgi:phytanoyl-CoA hydroxylase
MSVIAASVSRLRQEYECNGYAIARQVIDRDLIAEAREHIAWLLRKHPELRPEQLRTNLVVQDPFWIRLVSDDRLLDIAQQFIGPDIALFGSQYMAKPPFHGQAVLWHQDGSYWPLEPKVVSSLWLALDDSSPENGCMRVIPASQHLPLNAIQERHDIDNVLASGMEDGLVDETRAVDVVLSAGDVSIHHPQLIHGSNANTSNRWRRALTIRYIPTSTRIVVPSRLDDKAGSRSSPFLLRGNAVVGINTYLSRPCFNSAEHMAFRGCHAWS